MKFTAKLIRTFRRQGAPFTVGKVYEVVTFNEFFGTYTILNDNGEQATVDWLWFEDQGYKTVEYYRDWAA